MEKLNQQPMQVTLLRYQEILAYLRLQQPNVDPLEKVRLTTEFPQHGRAAFTYGEHNGEFLDSAISLCGLMISSVETIMHQCEDFNKICIWSLTSPFAYEKRTSISNHITCQRLAEVAEFFYVLQYEYHCYSGDIHIPITVGRIYLEVKQFAERSGDVNWQDRLFYWDKFFPAKLMQAHNFGVDFKSLRKIDFDLISGIDFKSIGDFDVLKLKSHMDEGDYLFGRKKEAESKLDEKLKKLDEHAKNVEKYSLAYGFISLSHAFNDMLREKAADLGAVEMWTDRLSVALIIVPLLVAAIAVLGIVPPVVAFLGSIVDISPVKGLAALKYLIPILSIELLLLYFYRVKLHQAKGLSAQILQLKYRLSLCQFIQDYAKYSKDVHIESPGLLEKFESVIFSPIMANEDSIPATFDGLGQLIDLFGGKRNS